MAEIELHKDLSQCNVDESHPGATNPNSQCQDDCHGHHLPGLRLLAISCFEIEDVHSSNSPMLR